MKMLDKVNYAIMRAFFIRPIEEQIFNVSRADNEDLARAAIEAMRVPTSEMIKACNNIMGGGFQNSHSDLETWETMIDEALKE